MQGQGMRWHLMQEIWDRGFQAVMADAVAEALEVADKLYISVDIDSLDPSMRSRHRYPRARRHRGSADLLRMVRQLAHEHDVVGVDVVEVAPAHDVSDLTVNVAHRIVFEALAGMAARRRDAAGVAPASRPADHPRPDRRRACAERRSPAATARSWPPELTARVRCGAGAGHGSDSAWGAGSCHRGPVIDDYDEFGLFAENAAEAGLAWTARPPSSGSRWRWTATGG